MPDRFRARSHVPRYSRMLWETLWTPVFVYLFLAGNFLLISGSLGFYFVEEATNPGVNSVFDAFWWGIATVTTVGFGDITPITVAGRFIGFGLICTGVLLFVGSSAILSSAFFAKTREEIVGLEDQTKAEWEQVLSELAALRAEVRALRPDA